MSHSSRPYLVHCEQQSPTALQVIDIGDSMILDSLQGRLLDLVLQALEQHLVLQVSSSF